MSAPRLLLPVLLLLPAGLGCPEGDPDPPPPVDDDDDDVVRDGLQGEVTVVHWPPDALFPEEELHLHAALSPELAERGYDDVVGWIAAGGLDVFSSGGWWVVPEVGERGWQLVTDVVGPLSDLTFFDAGPWIQVGDALVANVDDLVLEEGGPVLYDQPLELGPDAAREQPLDGALPLRFAGGADLPEMTVDAAVQMPAAPALTTHDPARPLPFRFGADLTVGWEPADEPDASVLVVLQDGFRALVVHAADADAEVTVPWADLLEFPQTPTVTVSRRARRLRALPGGGEVAVTTRSTQFLYPEPVEAWSVDPFLLRAGETQEVEIAWYDGSFLEGAPSLDFGPGIEVLGTAVADQVGHRLVATVRVDSQAATGPRDLLAGAGSGSFRATHAVWLASELIGTGTCEDVLEEPPPADGSYYGRNLGLPDDQWDEGACAYVINGREQPIPVHLDAGQRLDATLNFYELGLGTLYLTPRCDAAAPITGCATAPVVGEEVRLRHTAKEDEDWLLVVTAVNSFEGEDQPFVIDLRRSAPLPYVLEPSVVTQGETTTVTLTRIGGDWSEGEVAVDLGDGVTTLAVRVPGGSGPVAEVDIAVDLAALPGRHPGIVVTGEGTVIDPEALEIRQRVGRNTCEDVAASPAVVPGLAEGHTADGSAGLLTEARCNPKWEFEGAQRGMRMELGPSETLQVSQSDLSGDTDFQLVLMTECGGVPVACIDNDSAGGQEYLRWVAPREGADVVLVVQALEESDQAGFALDVRIDP